MTREVLLVDDDSNLLATYKRYLRKRFRIETATSGEQGLEVIDSQGPFAVIVSDLRMPGMDGIQFLSLAKARAPDSVCMMLTGYADLQTAIKAVNTGSIFRFLTKPCQPETLVVSLRAGIARYRLITAERELLERTLGRCVEVLTEILALVDPAAFSRAVRIKHCVRDITFQLQLPNLWQFEMAAMLSQIGCITLPPDVLEKMFAEETVSDAEHDKQVMVSDLKTGMVALEDTRAENGSVLVPVGQQVTYLALVRLRNFSQSTGVVEPFRVRIVSQSN